MTGQGTIAEGGAEQLRVLQPKANATALGMAVAFFMTDPVFAALPFGHWSRVLVGQINRKHYVFIVQGEKVVGFAGWAFATREKAETWLTGKQELSFADSLKGEIVLVNAWKATTREAHRALIAIGRGVMKTKEAVYYKRFYADGRYRPVRLNVNDFVNAGEPRHGGSES